MQDDWGKNEGRRESNDHPAGGSQDDIPALALGALDTTDEEPVYRELRASAESRRMLAEYEDVVGDLGLAVEPEPPSPHLRRRILDATAPRTAVAHEPARTAVLQPGWLASIAAAVVILALGTFSFTQWSAVQDRDDDIEELEARITDQQTNMALLQTAASSAGAFANFEEPLVWTPLATNTDGEPSGYLCRTQDGKAAYLVLNGVEVEAGQVLQAWLIGDRPVPVGTLRPSESGLGFLILQHWGDPVHEFEMIGVTIEPPGGSPQPTSDPIIMAEIV